MKLNKTKDEMKKMKCIVLIFVFTLMSCEKESSLKLNCVSPLKKEDFNIELQVLGNQQPITTVFDGKNQQKIANEYGENDWHISWKDSLFVNFRHFKTNRNDKNEYEFNFYKKNNLICVDVTIKGINSLHKTLIFSEKNNNLTTEK